MSDTGLKIGELAARTGVSVRSLRYYEQQQLLQSRRTAGGHRVYDDTALDRVHLIRHLLAAGVPTAGILQILPCVYSGTVTPAMLERLVSERTRIENQTNDLLATLDRLDGVIADARTRLR